MENEKIFLQKFSEFADRIVDTGEIVRIRLTCWHCGHNNTCVHQIYNLKQVEDMMKSLTTEKNGLIYLGNESMSASRETQCRKHYFKTDVEKTLNTVTYEHDVTLGDHDYRHKLHWFLNDIWINEFSYEIVPNFYERLANKHEYVKIIKSFFPDWWVYFDMNVPNIVSEFRAFERLKRELA